MYMFSKMHNRQSWTRSLTQQIDGTGSKKALDQTAPTAPARLEISVETENYCKWTRQTELLNHQPIQFPTYQRAL